MNDNAKGSISAVALSKVEFNSRTDKEPWRYFLTSVVGCWEMEEFPPDKAEFAVLSFQPK